MYVVSIKRPNRKIAFLARGRVVDFERATVYAHPSSARAAIANSQRWALASWALVVMPLDEARSRAVAK